MAENTKIEWAHHTFNPWMGCTKVSPACKHCYAERDMDYRYGKVAWGPNGTRVLTGSENWAKPVKWNREAKEKGVRHRVFCASLADVFEDWQGPMLNSQGERGVVTCADSVWFTNGPVSNCRDLTMDDVRTQLFALIDATPNLDWLLLTKRPENIKKMIPCRTDTSCDGDCADCSLDGSRCRSRKNIWLGCSVENQEYADKRIPELLKCRDLSPVLFLSCEPLLGPVDLNADGGWLVPWEKSDGVCGPGTWNEMFVCANNHSAKRYLKSEKHGRNICLQSGCEATAYPAKPGIDWVIAGGESGPEARPTDPEWFRSLRDQCKSAGVPFLFKQWGEFGPVAAATPAQLCTATFAGYKRGEQLYERLYRIGKSQAGRRLDGFLHNGFPNE